MTDAYDISTVPEQFFEQTRTPETVVASIVGELYGSQVLNALRQNGWILISRPTLTRRAWDVTQMFNGFNRLGFNDDRVSELCGYIDNQVVNVQRTISRMILGTASPGVQRRIDQDLSHGYLQRLGEILDLPGLDPDAVYEDETSADGGG